MAIPKSLHFTWKSEDLPGDTARCFARWQDLHPAWRIVLWTDVTMRDFIAETYPAFLQTYNAYPHAMQRTDCFRYLVLNALGGVCADLDVEPFRSIDTLVEGLQCFAGLVPDEQIGPDGRHSGVPFAIGNAFLGGQPGHPWFAQMLALLPETAGLADIRLSTGSGLTTAAALRLARAERPVLILPQQWSPQTNKEQASRSDGKLRALLSDSFDFAEVEGHYLAHRRTATRSPRQFCRDRQQQPFAILDTVKWSLRRWLLRELNGIDIKDPVLAYLDQIPKPPRTWPELAVCVIGESRLGLPPALVAALAGLDYPREKLSLFFSVFGTKDMSYETLYADAGEKLNDWSSASGTIVTPPPPQQKTDRVALSERHWRMKRWAMLVNSFLDADGPRQADWALFVDSAVTGIPAGALKAMLSADKPVVALGARDGDGREKDLSVFRYRCGGGLETVFGIRGPDGLADPARGGRDTLPDLKAFPLIPLDGAGQTFVLVRRDVMEAGVRFASEPYHLHMGGEGLALMARHFGFETVGLTEWAVQKLD